MRIEIAHSREDELYLEGDIDINSEVMNIFKTFVDNHIIDIGGVSRTDESTILLRSRGRSSANNRIRYHIIIRRVRDMRVRNWLKRIGFSRRWLKVRFGIDYNKVIISPTNIFLGFLYRIELSVDEADIEVVEV